MRKDSTRKIGSLFLLSTIWLSSTALPASVFAQTTAPQTSTDKKQDDKDKKDKKDKKQTDADKNKTAQVQTQTTTNKKTLSTNEDPAMIGKRDINGGVGGKFFGWLGGSKEKEAALGRQLATEVEQQTKMVDDPIITEYVNRIGQNIVLHSDAKVPFTIKVIDSDEVNAFALPGGYFFVNKGLLLAADNEAELAGVMAHEIAHVAARHAMENQGKATAMNYGMLAGIIFGGGIISSVLYNGGGILGGLSMLKFSRGAEEEADKLGVQYLYASGYDPTAMATMFEKLESLNKKKPGKIAKLFASHPQPTDRRQTSLELVARFPEREEYVMSSSEFQKVKARMLRFSNAKAATALDIDEDPTGPGKPTLKRRTPDTDDPNSTSPNSTSSPSSTSTDTQSGPPQLKRRSADPTPTPSPEL